MSFEKTFTLDGTIDKNTADWCVRVLEMYLIQNEEKTIRLNRENDNIRLTIDKRKCERTYDGYGGYNIEWLE